MYKTFYKLANDPFCLSPDHRFCYRHRSFAKARAYLYFALQRAEGFVMITGAPGSGKTTLLNQLVSEANTARFTIARLNTTQLGADDLLQMAAYAFRQNKEGRSKARILHELEIFLQQQHRTDRRAVLIVDEAQDLSFAALEEVRLLTNLELDGRPLLQVFLVGQDQLQEKICAPKLVQLQQRMIAHAHLEPMNAAESAAYIAHRLRVSGWSDDPQIAADAIDEIFVFSHGVPRRINQICSRLFLYGMVEEKHQLDILDLQHVIAELHDERLLPSEDETLFATRIAALQHEPQPAPESEPPRELQSATPLPEPARGAYKRDGQRPNVTDNASDHSGSFDILPRESTPPARDGAAHDSVAASNRTTARRIEAHPTSLKITSGTATTKPAGAFAMAVAHQLDETPATHRTAQIHALQPSLRPPATLAAAGATPSSEPVAPMPAMRTYETDHSRADYRVQSRRQWGFALLLSACMLAAALYTVRLDRSAAPPGAAGISQPASPSPPSTHIDTAAVEAASQIVETPLATRRLEERLARQGLTFAANGSGFVIDPGEDATFAFRSAVVNESLRNTLDRIIVAARESHGTMIRVIGHADASGPAEVNLDLSHDRADRVVKYLAAHGVPLHRLQSQAQGAAQLKSVNRPYQNRRVEIFIDQVNPDSGSLE